MTATPEFPLSPARRDFMKAAGLATATAAVPPLLLASAGAQAQPADLITRRIARTGEVVPAIGLGTYLTFDVIPGQPREHIREVIRRFWDGGGRVFGTCPLYETGEI